MKRAYGSEPVLLHKSPITATLHPDRQRSKRRTALFVLLGAGMSLLLLGAAALLLHRTGSDTAKPPVASATTRTPQNLQESRFPAGYQLDVSSRRTAAGVATYSILYSSGKKLAVSEQSKPADFDFEVFSQQLQDSQPVEQSSNGQIVMGTLENIPLASIVLPDKWVIIRAPDGIDTAALKDIALSFTQQ